MSVAVILGSAFGAPILGEALLEPVAIRTSFGEAVLHRYTDGAWVLFRHGLPHTWLPNQIPYRAHAAALIEVDCEALLITSSAGVLDRSLPLDRPIPVGDLLMPENRLPDGTACTMFVEPQPDQHHLVLDEGLISDDLTAQVEGFAADRGWSPGPRATFAYAQGPRTKTEAENLFWSTLGAQLNSMTVGPELVLANELGICCAAVCVGHKYSGPGPQQRIEEWQIRDSLEIGQQVIEGLAIDFLERAAPPVFRNRVWAFDRD
jgi:5'-methylthioadenosine phosphorylase